MLVRTYSEKVIMGLIGMCSLDICLGSPALSMLMLRHYSDLAQFYLSGESFSFELSQRKALPFLFCPHASPIGSL